MTDPTATPPAPPAEPSLDDLKARAREFDIAGRSKMDRDELVSAIAEAEALHDPSQQPTPLDVIGRPPLLEVAEESARRRAPIKVLGTAADADTDAQEG